jgi:hypothetical protein
MVMKRILSFFIVSLFVINLSGQNTDVLKQDVVFNIDELGNASMEISAKLNAQQWQNWENSYGDKNVSILKRDMERVLSYFYLYDFDYEQNEMERSYVLSFKAKGLARYLGDNEWRAEMGLKDPDFSKLTDNSYLVTSSFAEGGMIVQTNNKIFFPEAASNIEEDTDEFGLAVFDYELKPASTGGFPLFLVIGIVLIVLSAVAFFVMGMKKAPVESK